MTPSHLSARNLGLALLIVFFWGTNFVVVRWGFGRGWDWKKPPNIPRDCALVTLA